MWVRQHLSPITVNIISAISAKRVAAFSENNVTPQLSSLDSIVTVTFGGGLWSRVFVEEHIDLREAYQLALGQLHAAIGLHISLLASMCPFLFPSTPAGELSEIT